MDNHNGPVKIFQECPDLGLRLVAITSPESQPKAVPIPLDCAYSPLCQGCLTRRHWRQEFLTLSPMEKDRVWEKVWKAGGRT